MALPQQLDAIVLPRAFRRSRPLAPPALPSSCCLPPLSGSRLGAGADPQCNILQATGCSRPCCSALSPLAHQRLCKLAKIVMSAICLSSTAPFNQVWPDGRVPSPEPGRGYTTQMQQSGPHGPARVTVSTSELFLARVIRLWFPAAKVVAKLPQLHCLGNIWNTRSLLESVTSPEVSAGAVPRCYSCPAESTCGTPGSGPTPPSPPDPFVPASKHFEEPSGENPRGYAEQQCECGR